MLGNKMQHRTCYFQSSFNLVNKISVAKFLQAKLQQQKIFMTCNLDIKTQQTIIPVKTCHSKLQSEKLLCIIKTFLCKPYNCC